MSFRGPHSDFSGCSHDGNSSSVMQSTPSDSGPRGKARRKQDLPLHPQYLAAQNALLTGDLAKLLPRLEVEEGPNEASISRIACGTWNDNGVQRDAWLVVAKDGQGINPSVRFEKDASGKRLRGANSMKAKDITFFDLLKVDYWYPNDGFYKNIKSTKPEAEKKWKQDFLVEVHRLAVPGDASKYPVKKVIATPLDRNAKRIKTVHHPSMEEEEDDDEEGILGEIKFPSDQLQTLASRTGTVSGDNEESLLEQSHIVEIKEVRTKSSAAQEQVDLLQHYTNKMDKGAGILQKANEDFGAEESPWDALSFFALCEEVFCDPKGQLGGEEHHATSIDEPRLGMTVAELTALREEECQRLKELQEAQTTLISNRVVFSKEGGSGRLGTYIKASTTIGLRGANIVALSKTLPQGFLKATESSNFQLHPSVVEAESKILGLLVTISESAAGMTDNEGSAEFKEAMRNASNKMKKLKNDLDEAITPKSAGALRTKILSLRNDLENEEARS